MIYPVKESCKILNALIKVYEDINSLSEEHYESKENIFAGDIDFNLIQDLIEVLNSDEFLYFIKINNIYVGNDLSKIISLFLNEQRIEIIINVKLKSEITNFNLREFQISYK